MICGPMAVTSPAPMVMTRSPGWSLSMRCAMGHEISLGMALALEHDVEERLSGNAGHRGLACRVNIHEGDAVGLVECGAELVV